MRTNLAENLRVARTARGLRQSDFARQLGVSRATLHGWESGRRKPDLDQAAAIAAALGCTLDDLVKPDSA